MAAVAAMERTGIPMDAGLHGRLAAAWESIKRGLIEEVDRGFGVYEDGTFKQARFGRYLLSHGIPWPRLPSGVLALDETTFDEQARVHPQLRPLYELRSTLGKLRLNDIPIGADQRARCLLSPFRSVTGRNQPSSSKFPFGPARWIRGLVREREGRAVAYIDWGSQEVAVAAALSNDERLAEDYASNDLYMAFARSAGLVPPDATREGHEDIRDVCKVIVLGVSYGMQPEGMALRAGISVAEARELLRRHKATYRKFWRWSDGVVTTALFSGEMRSVFGWRRFVPPDANPRSLMNWPMQTAGSEMMRAAAIAATEAGIEVNCPVHDAFVISGPVGRINDDVAHMREIMRKAGRVVTGGLDLKTDVKIAAWPDRYMDKRGLVMWSTIMKLLDKHHTGAHERAPTVSPMTHYSIAGDTVSPTIHPYGP
jgi:hypothetical protein